MNIRKVKKEVKKIVDDPRLIRITLTSLKQIRQWSCINRPNSKNNMKILTRNFWRNGKFISSFIE